MELRELKDVLTDCNKQLNENDWIEVESKLNCTIPADLKRFYESCNGGEVKGNLYLMNGNVQTKIRFFIPIKYNKSCNDEPGSTMEGTSLSERVNPTFSPEKLIIGVSVLPSSFRVETIKPLSVSP